MENWKWLGHKQHLAICERCRFSLATELPNGYVVSTMGDYYPNGKTGQEEIGKGRKYETMVFATTGEYEGCGCPVINDWSELDSAGYNTARDATAGHTEMCKKWDGVIWK